MASERSPKPVRSSEIGFTPEAGERLSEVIKIIGSAKRAAACAGISVDQLARWRDGVSRPSFFGIVALCYEAKVNITWLASGAEPKFLHETENNIRNIFREEIVRTKLQGSKFADDFSLVPRLTVEASAGPGALVDHEDAIEMIAFQATWLRKRGINPGAARALTVRGDSMEPTIRSGDILLVDTSKDRIEDNGIYVVVSGGYVLVKRVHPRLDGSLMLISDNATYPPEDVPAIEASVFRVAGRVMWFGRSI